jgi:hypothetical protein
MDREGEAYTLAGKISAIIGTAMSTVATTFLLIYAVFVIVILSAITFARPAPAAPTATPPVKVQVPDDRPPGESVPPK